MQSPTHHSPLGSLLPGSLPVPFLVSSLQVAASSLGGVVFAFLPRCQYSERFCWKCETWRFWGQQTHPDHLHVWNWD